MSSPAPHGHPRSPEQPELPGRRTTARQRLPRLAGDAVERARLRVVPRSARPPARVPFVTQQLAGATGPIVAVTDYMKAVPDQIRQFLPNEFASLGADGFGFSDTRPAARRFFKIDGPSLVVRTLQSLAEEGAVDRSLAARAIEKYRLHDVTAGTSGNAGGES